MITRSNFIKALAGAVVASMIPFLPEPKVEIPEEGFEYIEVHITTKIDGDTSPPKKHIWRIATQGGIPKLITNYTC